MLKLLLPLILFTLLGFTQTSHSRNFLPENDLWKEDRFTKSRGEQEMFNKIIDAAYKIYEPIALDFGDYQLTIRKRWESSTVNANANRFYGEVVINMYGGLFRRPEVTSEGFALVLCHELSHAYGGLPYIRTWNQISAEGQADYTGAKECAHQVLAELDLTSYEEYPSAFMINICESYFEDKERQELCERSLLGGQSLANLFAAIDAIARPDYETPDPSVASETYLSYPDTVQCRLDTYLNGALQLDRPVCWFKD